MTEQDFPREDPNFPDRPQHDDFWKLSKGLLIQDERASLDAQEFLDELIDTDTALYAARQRVLSSLSALGIQPDESLVQLLAGTWIDGLVAGIQFGRAARSLSTTTTKEESND